MALTWKKLAFDDDLTTHIDNTTTAHGAVSAATASKLVVRDAQGQAAFAAPAGAGDALIKGTRHLIAEMPTLTTDKAWKGVGGVPAEVDWPAGGATLTVCDVEFFNATGPDPIAWTDEDFSGTVGSNIALVLLRVTNDTGFDCDLTFRPNGETEFTLQRIWGATNLYQIGDEEVALVFCLTDAAGILEWKCQWANLGTVTIDLIGYIA